MSIGRNYVYVLWTQKNELNENRFFYSYHSTVVCIVILSIPDCRHDMHPIQLFLFWLHIQFIFPLAIRPLILKIAKTKTLHHRNNDVYPEAIFVLITIKMLFVSIASAPLWFNNGVKLFLLIRALSGDKFKLRRVYDLRMKCMVKNDTKKNVFEQKKYLCSSGWWRS